MSMDMKAFRKLLFLVVCVAVAGVVFGRTALVTIAKVVSNPQELALQDAMSNDDKAQAKIVLSKTVHEMAFEHNKKGCADRHSLFLVTAAQYRDGVPIAEATTNPLFAPLIEAVYKDLDTYGIEDATMQSMERYDQCLKDAKPLQDASANYDMEEKFGACGRINSMAMDALSGAKSRQSIERVMSKYKKSGQNAVDLSETAYGSIDGVSELIVGKIYETLQTKGAEDASIMAAALSARCSQ